MNWFLYKIIDSKGLDTLFILETLAYAKERAVLMRVWDMVRKKRNKKKIIENIDTIHQCSLESRFFYGCVIPKNSCTTNFLTIIIGTEEERK